MIDKQDLNSLLDFDNKDLSREERARVLSDELTSAVHSAFPSYSNVYVKLDLSGTNEYKQPGFRSGIMSNLNSTIIVDNIRFAALVYEILKKPSLAKVRRGLRMAFDHERGHEIPGANSEPAAQEYAMSISTTPSKDIAASVAIFSRAFGETPEKTLQDLLRHWGEPYLTRFRIPPKLEEQIIRQLPKYSKIINKNSTTEVFYIFDDFSEC